MEEELGDNIEALERAARLPAKQRNINISITVQEIAEHAYTSGLGDDELQRILNIITVKSYLDQTSATTLIKNLYPISKVLSQAISAVIGAFGMSKSKPSAATQTLLVKWLASITDVLADPTILSSFYGVLFDLLDMITLRTPLCYLLSLITRRKHIRHHRVQRLLELCQQTGNEPALIGLLQVYKNFLPEIITGNVAGRRFSFASQVNIEWKRHLQAIQRYAPIQATGIGANGFAVRHDLGKSSLLTSVHTYHADENSVTLEEIQNAETLVANLDRIEPPSQIVTALKDPLLQKYLLLKPSPDLDRRIRFWLTTCYEDELEILQEGFGISPTLNDVLDAVVGWTESRGELDPTTQRFLQNYLQLTQGEANTGALLDLLSHLALQPFAEIHNSTLVHLERAVMLGAQAAFPLLLDFYTKLATRWASSLVKLKHAEDFSSQVANQQPHFIKLFEHASTIALSAIIESDHADHSILSFYSSVANATLKALQDGHRAIPVLLPAAKIIQLLTFSTSLATLSNLCTLLNTYKKIFATIVKFPDHHLIDPYKGTAQMNSHLTNTLNLVWRSKGLDNSQGSTGQQQTEPLCPKSLRSHLQDYVQKLDRDYDISSYFGLSFHAQISGLAHDTLVDQEDKAVVEGRQLDVRHAGPASVPSLRNLSDEGGLAISWKEYRVVVLDFMEKLGASGVGDFVFSNMKDLQRGVQN